MGTTRPRLQLQQGLRSEATQLRTIDPAETARRKNAQNEALARLKKMNLQAEKVKHSCEENVRHILERNETIVKIEADAEELNSRAMDFSKSSRRQMSRERRKKILAAAGMGAVSLLGLFIILRIVGAI